MNNQLFVYFFLFNYISYLVIYFFPIACAVMYVFTLITVAETIKMADWGCRPKSVSADLDCGYRLYAGRVCDAQHRRYVTCSVSNSI